MDCAGLVQAIHNALISPSAAASNISTADLPGLPGTSSTPHSAATSARCSALPMSRWPLIKLAMPPTSRPPMALGWPVRENGPAPGLPIWPVAKCRLISAAFFAVPLLDWFRPWQYKLSVAFDVANILAAVNKSSFLMPHVSATMSGVQSRTVVLKASNPVVCAAMYAVSVHPSHSMMCSMPLNRLTSVPG